MGFFLGFYLLCRATCLIALPAIWTATSAILVPATAGLPGAFDGLFSDLFHDSHFTTPDCNPKDYSGHRSCTAQIVNAKVKYVVKRTAIDVKYIMSNWFYTYLGDVMTASQTLDQIREAFLPLFQSDDEPPDMAIFTRNDAEGQLHCEVFVYFSPAAAEIARAFDAQPCDQPMRPGLELLAGSTSSWDRLFS
jgi:hypothetical protein